MIMKSKRTSGSCRGAGRRVGGSLALVLTFVLVGSGCGLLPNPSDEPRVVPVHDARTFFETTRVFGASFSHDQKDLLITSDQTGVLNVYRQPVDGGPLTALTSSTTDSYLGVSWFPNDRRFLMTADQGGNELNHVYVVETDGRKKDLTPGENLKASFLSWSGDDQFFYVLTNERDPKFFDLYRYKADDYTRKMVFENQGEWTVSAVSRDGSWIALDKVRNNADSDIYVWKVGSSADPQLITAHQGNVSHSVLSFTPSGNELYYLTNGQGEFNQAWSYDLSGKTHRQVLAADWDVSFVAFSKKGGYRVSGINEDARTKVSVVNTESGRAIRFPDTGRGNVAGIRISPSEDKIAFYVNGDTSPSNLHVLDLDSGDCRRLTDTLNPQIESADLVEGRVVRFPSFDEREIPAILYRPWPAAADRPVPALVWVHGGPGGQSRHGYRAAIQHLVNHGYAVFAVNNRGSSGYGKTFFHLDDRRHGDVDLKDCIWARRYLETLEWVDGEKVGIIGGSYGGYMVAAALAFEPEAFDVGVDIFGVTNWLRTLKSIPPWWSAFREALYAELGDPEKEEERLRKISPLFHASKIARPLLVIQGANDPRVLQVESDELVAAVERNGVPVEYVVFDDEGHGFRKKENQIKASESYVSFLDRYLKGVAKP